MEGEWCSEEEEEEEEWRSIIPTGLRSLPSIRWREKEEVKEEGFAIVDLVEQKSTQNSTLDSTVFRLIYKFK